jgi:NAD+ diphosphatase
MLGATQAKAAMSEKLKDFLAFVNSPIDRSAHLRKDQIALAAIAGSKKSRLVRICSDQVLMRDGKLVDQPEDGARDNDGQIFLGLDADGVAWFATRVTEQDGLVPLRSIFVDGILPKPVVDLLAQARSLVHWHERHGFCANCGSATAMQDAGYRRVCASCKAEHFPRTDPVVIMAIRHGDDFLLGRQSSWPVGMYSTLAGFMEPGETIEQAVQREVLEEADIRVGKVSYLASQPWPFPSSIMIGVEGEALSRDITIDPSELEDARWVSRDMLHLMLQGKHPEGHFASRPQAIAHYILQVASQLR